MAELFLNPWSMAAGVGLVSSPVVIHLINRMRYKRVRWAAMEFLLKAQKKVRRQVLLQQLLLLLLRVLLILLLGLLAGRFLGFSPLLGTDTRATSHVAVLDDTPSMADGWRGDDGRPTTAFEQAKRVLAEQIAAAAAEATSPQTLDLVRLSDLDHPRSFGRLNPAAIDELKGYLSGLKPQAVRVPVSAGLARANKLLDAAGGADVGRVVHVLTDLRAGDWAEDADAVRRAAGDLAAAKAKVHFVDLAHPTRGPDGRPPLAHDNVAAVELRPAKLTVARYEPVEFSLRVRNFGAAELKDVRFAVKVNGDDAKGRSVTFATLPGNQERTAKFELTFDRTGSPDKPFERFSLVTAALDTPEPGGIPADNVRQAVVEVRDRLPILAVEGRPGLRDKKDGDGFYLKPVFTSVLGGFGWEPAAPQELDKKDLRGYAAVFLLNVPKLSEEAVRNLEGYVRGGGGVGFFLGPDVDPAEYRRLLYADGAGLFPVPLPDKPTAPLTAEERLARLFTLQKKVLLRDPAAKAHPALAAIYTDDQGRPIRDDDFEKFFAFVVVDRYWPVSRVGKWRDDPSVAELYCLPNEQAMADYEGPVRAVADALTPLLADPDLAKYRDALAQSQDRLRRLAASAEPLYQVAGVLDRLLADRVGGGDPADALMRELWGRPGVGEVRTQAARLRDAVKYGPPLYLAKRFGRGRVTAVLTTAGETWTDWPTGPGRPSFVPLVVEMERYLSGGGADDNRAVGDPIELQVDAKRYKPVAARAFVTHDPATAGPRGSGGDPAPISPPVDLPLAAAGGRLALTADGREPGGYLFRFDPVKADDGAEFRAVAANVDAAREGDLRRVGADDVRQAAPGAEVHAAADADWLDALKQKQTDLSESGWIFLLLLAVLVAEQALAVRLSFHSAPTELDATAPSAAAVVRRHWGHHAGDPAHPPAA